eukprot:TRINITY_DN3086_c0_g1_i5.p1 TRINITY_DN3086_c0_g1~~TRINITY_DN3086_c0_g1_i5.p1  ORF type:complete len:139 (+),score=21.63 TRINITY_DN3086_c0_g1_i5:128-544(+)
MIRRPPRSTLSSSSAASDVYKRQPHRIVAVALVRRQQIDPGDGAAVRERGEVGVVLPLEAGEEFREREKLPTLATGQGAVVVDQARLELVHVAVGVYDPAIDQLARPWADRGAILEPFHVEGDRIELEREPVREPLGG